jgi:protocatechuate 3,4-dioxygenase beta subunit
MDNDDETIGRIFTRREAVEFLGLASLGLFSRFGFNTGDAAQAGTRLTSGTMTRFLPAGMDTSLLACVVRPEATEGPYFVDKQLDRSDIRVEPTTGVASAGVPLTVSFAVTSVNGSECKPISDAIVDVWMCDADGVYSGVQDMGFNTVGKKFLRGFQKTDKNGVAKFVSIYPGWYRGRTVHYHFKIRTTGADQKAYEFTSQLYFDDKLSDEIFSKAPYKSGAQRDTRNNTDMHYGQNGEQLLLKLEGDAKAGYRAAFNIGLDLANAETGKADNEFGGPGGRGGRGGPPGGPGGRGRGGPPPGGRGRIDTLSTDSNHI